MSDLQRQGSGEEIEYSNKRMIEVIDDYIHSERDRNILKRRLIDGILIDNLAEEFDLSSRQMQRILTKNENIVFKHYFKGA